MNRVIQRIALAMALIAFLVSISLWVFRTPKQFSSKRIEWVATANVASAPLSSASAVLPDVSANPPDICLQFDTVDWADPQIDAVVMALDSIGSYMSVEPSVVLSVGSTPSEFPPPSVEAYYLRINRVFSSEEEAAEYADSVLAEHDVDECWLGVSGRTGHQRFTLLVGPLRSRKDAAQIQSRLTAAKIWTLFVDQSFLRRFRSVVPVPEKSKPAVSSIASAALSSHTVRPHPTLPDLFPTFINFCRRWGLYATI